ncbi:hypothetical protein EON63_14145, partial [archaeon]
MSAAHKYIQQHIAVYTDIQHTLTAYFDVNRVKTQGIEAIVLELQDDLLRDEGVPPPALHNLVKLLKHLHLSPHPSFIAYTDAIYTLYSTLSETMKATEKILNKPLKDLKEPTDLLTKLTTLTQHPLP